VKIYLDMDGVLADFDTRATEILGMDSYKFEFMYGTEEFWRRLDAYPDLFYSFDPKPDMDVLWEAVAHLDPVILTALPKRDAHDVARQKKEWVAKYLHSDVHVIATSDCKTGWARPGTVLVDDRAGAYRRRWTEAGGHFVHHIDAETSVKELRALGVII
jgi:hypothetical protein